MEKLTVSTLPSNDTDETCRTFVFEGEGHTLGNALKCIISRYPEVQFCGYTVPHPAENKMHFRVQTSDGTSATEILKKSLEDLEDVCSHTIELFESELVDFNETNNMQNS